MSSVTPTPANLSLKSQGLRSTLLIGAVTAALVGGLRSGTIPAPTPSAAIADTQVKVRQEVGTFAKLAKQLKPSVVNIQTEKTLKSNSRRLMVPGFSEDPSQFQPRSKGQGSGVIISADGYIITNNHVVDGADQVKVTLSDGREMAARVIGTDPKTDVALVKVEGKDLPAAALGDSGALEVGDWVMAIGNPFGLDATVTVGVLSGKGRVIGAGPYDDFLQTDASINPGNSGGPLFNTQGEVIGINTAILPNGQGIGFSIPVNLAKDIVAQLKSTGKVTRGFLGLGVQPLTPKLKSALKMPAELRGALVSQLVPDGPAARAGARVEDIITHINGKAISSDRELLSEAARLPVGKQAELKVLRGGKETRLTVTVAERPDDQVSHIQSPGQDTSEARKTALGMGLLPLNSEIAAQLSTSDLKGVVVSEVASASPAQQAGLAPGDIIRKVNNHPVEGIEDFVSQLQKERSSGSLAFLVEREGSTRYVVIDG